MSPGKKRRRRLPTTVDRGLGLLEVIMPDGVPDELRGPLPPGRRDPSGFWYPARYRTPADIFSPAQRKLQENQRRIQRRRVMSQAAGISSPHRSCAGAPARRGSGQARPDLVEGQAAPGGLRRLRAARGRRPPRSPRR
ncbi:MAG: hypothetical protein ACE5JH_01800 [Acidobacteriota bacterium]